MLNRIRRLVAGLRLRYRLRSDQREYRDSGPVPITWGQRRAAGPEAHNQGSDRGG